MEPFEKSWAIHKGSPLRPLLKHRLWRKTFSLAGIDFVQIPVSDFQMRLNLKDEWGVSKFILKHGYYDPFLTRFKDLIAPSGSTILDIGANIGYHSLLFSAHESSRVFAFEPEPLNFKSLRRNLWINKRTNVQCFQLGVGEKNSRSSLFKSSNNHGDHQCFESGENRERINIDLVALDDFDLVPKLVDFVKMDIQGFETFALKGMKQILNRNPKIKLFVEVWPNGLKKSDSSLQELLAYLKEHEFNWSAVKDDGKVFELPTDKIEKYCKGHHVDMIFSKDKNWIENIKDLSNNTNSDKS